MWWDTILQSPVVSGPPMRQRSTVAEARVSAESRSIFCRSLQTDIWFIC